jgi:uncharacterized protein (TIGR02996 family)
VAIEDYSPNEWALLNAIRDAPRDDAPRLVYADWLEERGNPLGGFIRLQCEWYDFCCRRRVFDPESDTLTWYRFVTRSELSIKKYGNEWKSPFPRWASAGHFVRGFPTGSVRWPIRRKVPQDFERSCARMSQLLMFRAFSSPLTLAELPPLFRIPAWSYVTELNFNLRQLEPADDAPRLVEMLADLPALNRIEQITFAEGELLDEGRQLADRLLTPRTRVVYRPRYSFVTW